MKYIKKTIGLVIMLGVAVVAYAWWGNPESQDIDNPSSDKSISHSDMSARDEEANENTTDTITKDLDYHDGDYQSTVNYPVPNGSTHDLHLELTIQNDIVADMSLYFDDAPTKGTSDSTKQDFIDNVTPLVLGQDVETIKLARVGGSSLTTEAFNKALLEIKAQSHIQ